jgi:type II secretory pathway pseudopilin PulG
MRTFIKARKSFRGITIVEAVVAIAIFSLISGSAVQAYMSANAIGVRAATKTKALWLAEEGIEATRSIRDQNFTALSVGTHGISLTNNVWKYTGTSDFTDGYQRSIILTSTGVDSIFATSTVSWSYKGATSTVALGSHFTNWHKVSGTQSSHTTISGTNAYISKKNTSLLANVALLTDGLLATTTITQMQVAWSPLGKIKLIEIDSPASTVVYGSGLISSGTTITLTTPIVLAGTASSSAQFLWNGDVTGDSFTITVTFSDGSTQSITITKPPTQ